MYCPKCAAPIDGVKFCRQCGANVSLVPQALTGQLSAPEQTDSIPPASLTTNAHHRRRRRKERQEESPSAANGVFMCFMGVGFLIAAGLVLRYMPGGFTWGWAFMFPAFGCIGSGIAEILRASEAERKAARPQSQASLPVQAAVPSPQFQTPTTSELKLPAAAEPVAQPMSVIEHTTALLEP